MTPSFFAQMGNLQRDGPMFEAAVAPNSFVRKLLEQQGKPFPAPISLLALVDTGATGSVIKRGLPGKLGLHPIGIAYINTPSSVNVACPKYAIEFMIPSGRIRFEGTVIEAPLQNQNTDFLVGRDILSRGVLVYTGFNSSFSLSF